MDNLKGVPPEFPDGRQVPDFPLPQEMPWLIEANRLLRDGVDLYDERSFRILRYARFLDMNLPIDVPWCGLFAYQCIKTAYPETRTPLLPMRARPWLRYGKPVKPQFGALLVFWLYHRNSQLGHVGFYISEDDDSYHVLGGNQHNNVRIQRVGKSRLMGAVWPTEAFAPAGTIRVENGEVYAPFEFNEQEARKR